jgi:hypothetical protein
MRLKMALLFIGLFLFGGAAGLAIAQDTTPATHKKVRTLTGCLQKCEGSDEYTLTAKDGGTWEVTSDAVKFGPHVGHTVTITGAVSNATAHGLKEDAKGEAKEHGIDKNSKEHGHMTVTNLKMVSASCEK